MFGLQQETPSRILRRIQANELEDDELPTLPSAPGSVENSLDVSHTEAADKSSSGASGSSMVVRRRPGRAMAVATRGILSPLNANRHNNSHDGSSPQTAGKGKGRASVATQSPRRSQQQERRAAQRIPPPSTVASAASSAQTVRAVSFPLVAKKPGETATNKTKEVSFVNDTAEESSLNLDDSILSPHGREEEAQIQDDSSLQGLRDLDDDYSEERDNDRRQLDNDASTSGQHEEEEAEQPTPVPATNARFRSNEERSRSIPEEQEDLDKDDDSLPALPSPGSSSIASSASPAGVTGDTSEQRIAQHVVLRRRTNPIIRKSGLQHVVNSPDSAASATTPLPPAAITRQESSLGSTPGIGRRLPSAERRRDSSLPYPEISVSYVRDDDDESHTNNTPSKLHSPAIPPSTAVSSRAYPDSEFATPRPAGSDADLQRRKSHLLSTLRLTALRSGVKPKLKRGTPHPARRARSLTPLAVDESTSSSSAHNQQQEEDNAEDHTTSSSISSASTSSHDLTTHPRGNGNTSLPLTGAITANTAANRFNGAKLNNYLHTLNTHLSSENQNLVKTLEETAKEVQRLLAKNRELSGVSGAREAIEEEEEEGEGDRTREMLEGHRKTREDIQRLREHLTGSTPLKHGSQAVAEKREQEKEAEHARQLADLQKQLQDRDESIASLRSQLLAATNSEAETTNSHLVPELRQQIFTLQDELSSARSESSSNASELAKLRQEIVSSATRHTSAISDLQNRTDELLLQLEERDAIIEEAEKRLEEQEEGFKLKMRKLEEELCGVMEEQERQLREAKREAEELKQAQKERMEERAEGTSASGEAEKEIEELKREKARLERHLDEATATISTGSGKGETAVLKERVSLLQAEVAKQQTTIRDLNSAIQQARDDASSTARSTSQEIRDLKDDLAKADSRAVQAERKTASSSTALKEPSSQLEEAQANLRNAENQITRLTRQLQECHSTISELQKEQLNASFAILESETQKKLEAAQRELGNLKHQLASPSYAARKGANNDVRDLEIRTLRSSNHELETRVNQLKKQALLQQSNSNGRQNAMQTPLKGAAGGYGTPEKSVRFDSVRSMKTPKSVSQMLAGMSFLDKTDANATIAPLYTEIDDLHNQVKHYQSLLQQANDDVDDKLQKLNRAGAGTVDLARELEDSKRRVRELERELQQATSVGVGGSGQAIIAELRGVKEQLINERSDLTRRLSDIKQHCHQISSQLDASRLSQSETQRSLDLQLSETRRLRQLLSSKEGAFSELDSQRQALIEERNSILQGVAALHRDLNKVQKDARDIGEDLRMAKQGETGIRAPFGSATCTKQACIEQQARQREEAKGLLVMIKYLKLKFLRESYLRADLAHQKLYLSLVISQKQKIMDATNVTLARFGMPPPAENRRARPTLRMVANAVLSTIRMKRMSEDWRRQSAVKESLRDAYRQTRGKDFPN